MREENYQESDSGQEYKDFASSTQHGTERSLLVKLDAVNA